MIYSLIDDVIIHITSFLDIPNKLNFLSTSKYLHLLKDKSYYDKCIQIHKIQDLWYFDRFTSVSIDSLKYKLPKSITHLEFLNDFNKNCGFDEIHDINYNVDKYRTLT